MRDSPTNRRMALQALLALGGLSFTRDLLAEPNFATRVPGTPEDLSGALEFVKQDQIGRAHV